MYLCFVKHMGSNVPFLFHVDDNLGRLTVGDKVLCTTRGGLKHGIVLAEFHAKDETAKVIAEASRGYWPLAKITGKFIKPVVESIDDVPDWIVEKIRKQEANALIAKLGGMVGEQRLPFDT